MEQESLLPYQREYLAKEKIYKRYRSGELTLEDASRLINRIDRPNRFASLVLRCVVGLFLPLLFVRPAR